MDLQTFATLVVIGFTTCAEFESWAFVHPMLWQLPVEQHIRVEQGLLSSFGRGRGTAFNSSLAIAIPAFPANLDLNICGGYLPRRYRNKQLYSVTILS